MSNTMIRNNSFDGVDVYVDGLITIGYAYSGMTKDEELDATMMHLINMSPYNARYLEPENGV